LRSVDVKITAAMVPVRSAPFEIETLDLAAPLADEVLVRVVASGMVPPENLATRLLFSGFSVAYRSSHDSSLEGAGFEPSVPPARVS
jgi:NADPH:quinone reductase-like Zn-dependent oxidoreductase